MGPRSTDRWQYPPSRAGFCKGQGATHDARVSNGHALCSPTLPAAARTDSSCSGGGTQEDVSEDAIAVRLPLPFPNEGQ